MKGFFWVLSGNEQRAKPYSSFLERIFSEIYKLSLKWRGLEFILEGGFESQKIRLTVICFAYAHRKPGALNAALRNRTGFVDESKWSAINLG